jgi:hypothetical protein
LELLLASSSYPSPPARATSLTLHNRPAKNQDNTKKTKKRTRSPRIAFTDITETICLHGQSIINNDNLPLMKKSIIDLIPPNKTRQSNSFDSGCYDRSSSSDTHSITSFSINQASSSLPSARLTSASTRRSNTQKKVSFEDQSSTMILNTATYV